MNKAALNNLAKNIRNNLTDAEKKLWQHLRCLQMKGFKFRRQAVIGKYIVDFVCFDKKLVVELDGSQHLDKKKYDTSRTVWLESQGFKVIRVWNNQVFEETDFVLNKIAEELDL